jgi:hypothetical protein
VCAHREHRGRGLGVGTSGNAGTCIPWTVQTRADGPRQVWEAGEALFNIVRGLRHLSSATCTRVLFKADWFNVVAGSPALRSLSLQQCTFSSDGTRFALERVALAAPPGLTGFAASSFGEGALSLLDPIHLRVLSLDAPAAVAMVIAALADGPPLDQLEELELVVPRDDAVSAHLQQLLARCPILARKLVTEVTAAESQQEEHKGECDQGECRYHKKGEVGFGLL